LQKCINEIKNESNFIFEPRQKEEMVPKGNLRSQRPPKALLHKCDPKGFEEGYVFWPFIPCKMIKNKKTLHKTILKKIHVQ